MMQEIADMRQEIAIAVMKLEKAGMRLEINMLTFCLQSFVGSDDDLILHWFSKLLYYNSFLGISSGVR